METRNKLQVLNRSQLKTLHNNRAMIVVGTQIPYPTGTSYTNQGFPITNTEQRDVGTTLDIMPRIMPDGMVSMTVFVRRSSIGSESILIDGNAIPVISNADASTVINAMDGETVIFAGLISETKMTTNNSVPGLNKIPIIKHFFEYESTNCRRTELLIVLTPTIIRSPEDMARLNQQEHERMHWCKTDVVNLTKNSGMKLRSDEWYPSEVRHTYGTPTTLNETQLPADVKIPVPLPPAIETK
jgi:general secretion pathway protein D